MRCGVFPPSCVQVKGRLLFEQKKIAAFQQRKREQESRKFAREVRVHFV